MFYRKENIRKKYIINFRMSTEQYYSIKGKAKEANMSLSDYIRNTLGSGVVRARITPEQAKYLRMLSLTSNNLNQLTKSVHIHGIDIQRIEQMNQLIEEIGDFIRKIR